MIRQQSIGQRLIVAAVALLSALPGVADAQALLTVPRYSAFEAFVSQTNLDPALEQLTGGARRMEGAGGRLLFRVGVPPRLALGGFFTYEPEEQQRGALWHGGLEADLHPLASPVFGRVDPIVSLGGGMLRVAGHDASTYAPPSFATSTNQRTGFCLRPTDVLSGATCSERISVGGAPTSMHDFAAISPALGARIGLLPGFALRVDARDVIVFDRGPRHNRELTTGISLLR